MAKARKPSNLVRTAIYVNCNNTRVGTLEPDVFSGTSTAYCGFVSCSPPKNDLLTACCNTTITAQGSFYYCTPSAPINGVTNSNDSSDILTSFTHCVTNAAPFGYPSNDTRSGFAGTCNSKAFGQTSTGSGASVSPPVKLGGVLTMLVIALGAFASL